MGTSWRRLLAMAGGVATALIVGITPAAGESTVATNVAIFSASTSCEDGLQFNGDAISIHGHVHSNGEYKVNSSAPPDHFWALSGSIASENCVAELNLAPEGAQYGEGPEPRDFLPQDSTFQEWPVWFTPADFGWLSGCTYVGSEIFVRQNVVEIKGLGQPDRQIPHSGTVPTGTYCATLKFTVSGENLRGEITALSREIIVDGNRHRLAPHRNGVLFFIVPNTNQNPHDDGSLAGGGNPFCQVGEQLVIHGFDMELVGLLFNPCGRIVFNVVGTTGTTLFGAILGREVNINADGFLMVGTLETDTTPPEIASVVTPEANAAGWHSTPPTVTFVCTDADSGVAFCPEPVTVTTDGAGQVVEGTATDRAGNTASTAATVSVDQAPPVVRLRPGDFSVPATGPDGAVVTFVVLAFDGLAEWVPVECAPSAGSVFPIGETIVTCSASDLAGNTMVHSFTVTVLETDTTPPAITAAVTPEANTAGWHSTPPTVTFTCTDAASGIAFCPEPVTVSSEAMGQVVEGTALDNAGNSASVSVTVNVDLTRPVLSLPGDFSTPATSPTGAVVTFSATASDNLAGNLPLMCTPHAGSVLPIGATTVLCSASDPAGNTAVRSFAVTVLGASAQVAELENVLDAVVAANAGTPIADKVEDATGKLRTALSELAKSPPDRQAAAAAIEGAAGDLQAAVSKGLPLSSSRLDAVVGVGRLLAETAITRARARGAKPSKVADATKLRDQGDARRAAFAFKDAAAKYKDAVAKADSA